jgi:hypothetical protein
MAANWYFTKEELLHNLTADEIKTDTQHRKSTCSFLQDAGMQLRLYRTQQDPF